MIFLFRALLTLGLLITINCLAQDPIEQIAEPGFLSLFNGRELDTSSWDYSPLWKVKNGEITTSGQVTAIEFCTYKKKKFQDFVLKAKFILVNNQGNSGIHFRSRYLPGRKYNVGGYQADIGWDWWCRLIYWMENANPNVIILSYPANDCLNSVHKDSNNGNDWNEYTITAIGAQIKLEMNGKLCSEYTETDKNRLRDSGYVALQLHNPEYTQLRFRDIRIKSLDESVASGIASKNFKAKELRVVKPPKFLCLRSKRVSKEDLTSVSNGIRPNGQLINSMK
jgi:hypothetical protein